MADEPLDVDTASQAVEDALRAWVRAKSEGDDVLTGYVVITSAVLASDSGKTAYACAAMDGQPSHVTEGLVCVGQRWCDDVWNDDEDE